jgi:hypothetical protein
MIRAKTGNQEMDGGDEDSDFSNCRESTASGMFSWSGLHVDSCGGCALYMMARNTAETVGMYAVLFRASSHVSPMSWQSLLNILLALSFVGLSPVPFLYPPFSCGYQQYTDSILVFIKKRKESSITVLVNLVFV